MRHHLTAPLRMVDAVAQWLTDALVFFLMRVTGWPKSFVRYAFGVANVVALVGLLFCWPTSPTEIVVMLMVTALSGLGLFIVRRNDEKLERDGLVAAPSVFRWFMWYVVVKDCFRAAHWSVAVTFVNFAFDVTGLLCYYSSATPPRPPDRKPIAVMTPARARS